MAAGHIVDPDPDQRDWTLRQALAHWSERLNAEFYFILDQFEEYFLYHDDVNDRFAVELAEAVAGNDRWAHFLLSVREDALAKLDRFQGRIPNLFDNYYRLDHLDAKQARSAIVGPLEEANRGLPESAQMTIEPELVDTVLLQVRTGQVQVGNTGEGKIESSTGREAVETAHLQLVMTRLWEAERQAGSNVIRLSTLERVRRRAGDRPWPPRQDDGRVARARPSPRGPGLQATGDAVGDEDRPPGRRPRRLRGRPDARARSGAREAGGG